MSIVPDHWRKSEENHALLRIKQAEVSSSCKALAMEIRKHVFFILGQCSIFWDQNEDSITFEEIVHYPDKLRRCITVHGGGTKN